MKKISLNDFQELVRYLQDASQSREIVTEKLQEMGVSDEGRISNFIQTLSNPATIKALENVIKESGSELNIDELMEYTNRARALVDKHGFATPLLIKEIPADKAGEFNRSVWQKITTTNFLKLPCSKEEKPQRLRWALRIGSALGAFRDPQHAALATVEMLNNVQSPEQVEWAEDLQFGDRNGFTEFLRKNVDKLLSVDINSIKEIWNTRIRESVRTKNFDEVQSYMAILQKHDGNYVEAYLEYNNVPEERRQKIRNIIDFSMGRTQTSIPTHEGGDGKHSHEIIPFDSMNVATTAENAGVKCCMHVGGNAQTSLAYGAFEKRARQLMMYDEKGEPLASSLVTHTLDKEGRSYVCFDNIELNSSKTGLTVPQLSFASRLINELVKKGVISSAEPEVVKQYLEEQAQILGNEKDDSVLKMLYPDSVLAPKVKGVLQTVHQKWIKPHVKPEKDLNFFTQLDRYWDKWIITSDISVPNLIKALEYGEEVKRYYKDVVIRDMIREDEAIRRKQLEEGKLTPEEYNQVLMRNGRFTVGDGCYKMYMGDIAPVNEKGVEKLRKPEKGKSLYEAATLKKSDDLVAKIVFGIGKLEGIAVTTFGGGILALSAAVIVMTPTVPLEVLPLIGYGGVSVGLGRKMLQIVKRDAPSKVHGIYTDAKAQRIFYDGRDEYSGQEISREQLLEKMAYEETPQLDRPTRVSELSEEQRKMFRRLREAHGGEDFSQEDADKFVIGNGKNWYALLTREGESITVNDVVTSSTFSFAKRENVLADAQVDLINKLKDIASRAEEVRMECENPKVNEYLTARLRPKKMDRAKTIVKSWVKDRVSPRTKQGECVEF